MKKKLDLRGVMTAPGFSMKKKDLLTQIEKTLNPRPHPDAGGAVNLREPGRGLPLRFGTWGRARGFF